MAMLQQRMALNPALQTRRNAPETGTHLTMEGTSSGDGPVQFGSDRGYLGGRKNGFRAVALAEPVVSETGDRRETREPNRIAISFRPMTPYFSPRRPGFVAVEK